MAENTNQTGPSPEQQMHQTLKMSHGVAQQAAKAHSDGLAKMMQAIQGLHAGAMQNSMQQAGPPMQDPSAGGGDPQQAVWDAFPSTDPQMIDRMIQQSGSIEEAFPALAHMLEQNTQSLQDKWLQAVSERLGQPSGAPDSQMPANPGVGGEATAAY